MSDTMTRDQAGIIQPPIHIARPDGAPPADQQTQETGEERIQWPMEFEAAQEAEAGTLGGDELDTTGVDAVAVVKVVIDVIVRMIAYFNESNQPDLSGIPSRIRQIQDKLSAIERQIGKIEDILYKGTSAGIRAQIASAEEAMKVHLGGGGEVYLQAARDHSLQALTKVRLDPYTWLREVDTYLRGIALRVQWFNIAIRRGLLTEADRKPEMQAHYAHVNANIVAVLEQLALERVKSGEVLRSIIHKPGPILIMHYMAVWEIEEDGRVINSRLFYFKGLAREPLVVQAAEKYRRDLLENLRVRMSIPTIKQLLTQIAALA